MGIQTDEYGGSGGQPFAMEAVHSVGVHWDGEIDTLLLNGVQHGGNGGTHLDPEFTLAQDEYISRFILQHTNVLTALRFFNHFTSRRYWTSGVVGAFALAATVLPSAAAAATGGETVPNARNATAIYTDAGAAPAAGYELLTDAAGIACIDQPGEGAMGVHFVKGSLVQSGTLDAARPQALVYQVGPSGRLELAALEYVVFQSTWDAGHSGPPTLFGQKFMLNPADNRFGLPAFYALHAWVWKHNPKGMFEPWNPDVHCANDSTTNAATPDGDSSPQPMQGM